MPNLVLASLNFSSSTTPELILKVATHGHTHALLIVVDRGQRIGTFEPN